MKTRIALAAGAALLFGGPIATDVVRVHIAEAAAARAAQIAAPCKSPAGNVGLWVPGVGAAYSCGPLA